MTNREWLGRRLPLWTLVLVGVVLLGVAALLLFLVDSMLVFLAISPLTIVGLYTLAYAFTNPVCSGASGVENGFGNAAGTRIVEGLFDVVEVVVGLDLVDRKPALEVQVDQAREEDRGGAVAERRAADFAAAKEQPRVQLQHLALTHTGDDGTAAMDSADADDAVLVTRDRELDPPRQDGAFTRLIGVHAGGRDFGPRHNPPRPRTGPDLTPDEEEALIESAFGVRERCEAAKAAVARGDLDAAARRSWQRAMSASLTLEEAADWLDAGTTRILTSLAFGDLFAFVCDDELRFPAWQFTDEPNHPVLDHLSTLAGAFEDDMHPTSILGFMTTPHPHTRIHGVPATPVEWLTAGRHVQPLLEPLETRRLR